MEGEPVTKKQAIKRGLAAFFGTIAFVIIFSLIFVPANEIPWIILAYLFGGFFIFVALIAFFTYKFINKNRPIGIAMNNNGGKKNMGIFVIIFGLYLIISGLISVDFASMIETKMFLFKVGFGALTVIWGIYNYKKNKN